MLLISAIAALLQSTEAPSPTDAPPGKQVVPTVLFDCAVSADSQQKLERMDAVRYRWFGQSTDPESIKTGRIDVGKIVAEVERRWGPEPSGWGMLDYEEPFDSWLSLPPDDPRNRQAVEEMARAIRMVKLAYPNVKWTYYGTPRLERWLPKPDGTTGGWSISSEDAKRAELERRTRSLAPLFRELDWINPSFYDVYENSAMAGAERDVMLANEDMWRLADAGLGREIRKSLGLPQIPVIPCVSPLFQPGGKATAQRRIPKEEFLSDQVMPAIRGGCDGVAIWTGADFIVTLATMGKGGTLTEADIQTQRDARYAWLPLVPQRRGPGGWEEPEVKLALSSAIGDAIADAADAARTAFSQARRRGGAAATPGNSPGKTAGSPAARP
jgi:hypothetical protein